MDYPEAFKKWVEKEGNKISPLPDCKVSLGETDKNGNLLILASSKAYLFRTYQGLYTVVTGKDKYENFSDESEAISYFNKISGTSYKPDYISSFFQPWFIKKEKLDEVYKVPSRTSPGVEYEVAKDSNGNLQCTCTGFTYRGSCWHVDAVRDLLKGKGEK